MEVIVKIYFRNFGGLGCSSLFVLLTWKPLKPALCNHMGGTDIRGAAIEVFPALLPVETLSSARVSRWGSSFSLMAFLWIV